MTDQTGGLWAGEALDSPARDLRHAILKHPHPADWLRSEVGGLWQEYLTARAAHQAAEAALRNAAGHAAVITSGREPVAARVIRSRPAEQIREDFFVGLSGMDDQDAEQADLADLTAVTDAAGYCSALGPGGLACQRPVHDYDGDKDRHAAVQEW